ncbi:FHA domain-containing protein [Streptomyces luomodiensis]|uniref:FHA domain-containing protein n=1 Tax=Streptomyces luomodiensis TaxID=3026192 RepID=A0ABY9UWW6_9ACTN|nr:FHA domain-containing protein [Streptomyces sp. SCA4-21]WNE96931.1 FHA domain-containing protein [Streptomyces sp. SCA4-21]
MQIRLTVLGPRSAHPGRSGHHPAPASAPRAAPLGAVDVLVTAPVGTALASVAGGLADAVAAAGYEAGGGSGGGGGAVVLYAGGERLDPQRCALGEPPLVDGAVLSLHGPADPDTGHYPGYPGLPEAAVADATVHLDVVAGPDAGGVHLLHGGQVRIGRSADADVPLDDPDVSRLHCAVTVAEDGRVTIADLGSTNGTAADGVSVGAQPVPLEPGALLRIGESALRLRVPSAASAFPSAPTRLPVHADGEGHLRVAPTEGPATARPGHGPAGTRPTHRPAGTRPTHPEDPATGRSTHAEGPWTGAPPSSAPTHTAQGTWTPPNRNPDTGWTRVPQAGDPPGPGTGPASGASGPEGAYGRRDDGGRGPSGGSSAGPTHPTGHGDRPTGDGPRPAPGTPGGHGPGRAQDVRDDWRASAPAGPGGAGADGRRSHGTPEDPRHGGPAADTGRRGAPPRGGDGPRYSATDDPRYDDPSTARTRRNTAPQAGAAGRAPAGQPARGGEEPWARGGQGGRAADATPDHRHTPREATGAPAGPGGSPYGGPAAGHGGQGEGDADSGRQPRPGTGYGNAARGGQPRGQGHGEPAERAHPGGQPGATPHGGPQTGGAGYGNASRGGAPAGPSYDSTAAGHGRPGEGGAGHGGSAGQGGSGPRHGGDRTHVGTYALDAPGAQARRRGIGAWVRQLAGGKAAERGEPREDGGARDAAVRAAAEAEALQRRWPDPATVLMTALGPGPRLWERAHEHPDALAVRLGSADRLAAGGGLLPAAPVTVDLRQSGSLGLAGPRARVAGLVRSVVAQLAALHSPAALEIVLISREERLAEWSWLGWLPHLKPLRGQDCRLLLAYDVEQATARTAELTRRLEDGPLGPGWASASPAAAAAAAARHSGPYTVVVVDGAPGPAALDDTLARLAVSGPAAGIHLLCLAEAPAASPTSPLPRSYVAACAASAPFAACGVAAVLSGDVATGLQIVHGDGPAPGGIGVTGVTDAPGATGVIGATGATGATTTVTVDAVSAAWAERFARALAPLRPATAGHGGASGGSGGPPTVPLPDSARLLDELGLARATPASLMARWAAAADEVPAGGRALAVLGAGPRGPLSVDLAADGPHALIDGAAGTGKTELLRSFAASLAAAERPDRLELILVDGAGAGAGTGSGAVTGTGAGTGTATGTGTGEGLRVCTDLPHVSTHLTATDPVRMREFAQALSSELKRRAELLGPLDFTAWHARHLTGEGQGGHGDRTADAGGVAGAPGTGAARVVAPRPPADIDPPPGDTLRTLNLRAQRTASAAPAARPRPLPRLVVLVDDFDALVAPALGSPGRPAAGSVVRALEAIARDGARLGVHLVVASGRPDRTADTAAVERAGLRIALDPRPLNPAHPAHTPGTAHPAHPRDPERPHTAPASSTRSVTTAPAAAAASGGDPAPGRGRLFRPGDAAATPFQAGRVTGRIPRTATQRPTVVPLEWRRMGDPPTRRPLRELGNGPTDLALLASALQRAAQSADAPTAPALI